MLKEYPGSAVRAEGPLHAGQLLREDRRLPEVRRACTRPSSPRTTRPSGEQDDETPRSAKKGTSEGQGAAEEAPRRADEARALQQDEERERAARRRPRAGWPTPCSTPALWWEGVGESDEGHRRLQRVHLALQGPEGRAGDRLQHRRSSTRRTRSGPRRLKAFDSFADHLREGRAHHAGAASTCAKYRAVAARTGS